MADSVADFGAIRSAQLLAVPLHPILVHFTLALATASLVARPQRRPSFSGFAAVALIAELIR